MEGEAEEMKSLERVCSHVIEGEENEAHTLVAGGDRILIRTGHYYCYYCHLNKEKPKYPFVIVGKN